MIRLIGACLVAAGCAWAGFGAAARLGARTRALEEVAEGLTLMAQELTLHQPPLEQLMERLIPHTRGEARALFLGCQEALGRLEDEPFSLAWRRLVEERTILGKEGQACLYALGETLGRCDCSEQQRALAGAAGGLEQARARSREEGLRLGRVYQVLGLSGGAFLIILLL